MNTTHKPSPEFVTHLEWQVRTSLSRHDRFSQPVSRPSGRLLKLAALVLISAFIGAAGVTATDMVQDSKIRDYFLNRIDMKIQLAETRLEHHKTLAKKVAKQYENGLVGTHVLEHTEQELQAVRSEYARLTLDREEIVLTGREPLQNLSAPLVEGRDFVNERLALSQSMAEEVVRLAEASSARERKLVEAGLMSPLETHQQSSETMSHRQRLNIIKAHRQLRQRFLDGELTAEQVEREAMVTVSRHQIEDRKLAMGQAQARLDRAMDLHQHGMIHQDEVRRTRLELQQHELELQGLLLSLEHFGSSDGESSAQ